jgi:lathosterol oxidase
VGYELAPFIPTLEGLVALAARGLAGRGLAPLPALNTVQHHDLHHRFPR